MFYLSVRHIVLAATQTPGEAGMNWFQGTADAVRQFTWVFEDVKNKDIEHVLILSGDHLYRMDYMDFVQNHIDRDADITVSCVPVGDSRASEFGLMKIDNLGQVTQFAEKPRGADLEAMKVDTSLLGLSSQDAAKSPYIASMGVYVFKKEILLKLLTWRYPTSNDFGSEIIPSAVTEHNVQAYLFRDYWEDIGTIKSFYDANLALTDEVPNFEFYDPKKPIFTSPRFLPPTKFERSQIKDAIISHGCFLQECSVIHSIVGERSRLDSGVELKMGSMETSIYYCCVSRGDRILYAYRSGDDEIEKLALLCLEKTPPYHKWYFETIGKRRFGFLMEDGYVYFAIADVRLGKTGVLQFLEHIRDEFVKMNKGLRKSMSNLDSLGLQENLVPVIHNLISTLEKVSETAECLKETPSPPGQTEVVASTKAPLLGKPSKLEKKKMKEHAIAMRDIQLEEHRRSTDRVIKTDSGDLDSNRQDASLSRKDSARIRSSNSNVQRKYRRQVRIVLAIDAAVCLLLFLIWLLICGGTKCI